MANTIAQFEIGQTVQLQDGRMGIVRYTGETRFSTGTWVGVELSSPTGKNDGSVQGERYFQCPSNHGIFVRSSALSVVAQATASSSSTSSNGTGIEQNQAGISARPSTAESTGTAALRLRQVSRQLASKSMETSLTR